MPIPISTSDISSIRLDDQDKVLSDAIAEVQLTDDAVTVDNYRFEFKTQRSFMVGVQSFFKTPIGIAITSAFFVAIVVLVLSAFL